MHVLSHSEQERRDPSLSRGDYMERLAKDLKEYYGYLRELIDMFLLVSILLYNAVGSALSANVKRSLAPTISIFSGGWKRDSQICLRLWIAYLFRFRSR